MMNFKHVGINFATFEALICQTNHIRMYLYHQTLHPSKVKSIHVGNFLKQVAKIIASWMFWPKEATQGDRDQNGFRPKSLKACDAELGVYAHVWLKNNHSLLA